MVSLNMMYNHYFSFRHSLIVGVQSHLQFLDESLLNPTRGWMPPEPGISTVRRMR